MSNPKLVLTLLPPPLILDHAVLYAMGQVGFADPRYGTRDGRPVRPGFEGSDATRAIRLAVSGALHRLSDGGLRGKIATLLSSRRRMHVDELHPSEMALTRVSDQDADAARAIANLAICRVINTVDQIPPGHPVRTLAGRVILVDVNLIALLSEIAHGDTADLPVPLRDLLLENFGTPCVLHVDGVQIPARLPPPPPSPPTRAKPVLRLVSTSP